MNLGSIDIGVLAAVFAIYILAINIVSFVLFKSDKMRARNGQWRISEKALLLSALLGGSLGAFVGMRVYHHKTSKLKFKVAIPVLLAFQLLTLVAAGCGYAYFVDYYHADADAEQALKSTAAVEVIDSDDYCYFDGPGTESAFVFYPGAKVEASAYASLMKRVASTGTDCFLVKMPLNFALLGIDKAKKIQESYEYDSWLIGGHSLGGVASCMYVSKHSEEVHAVVLLASYSTEDLTQTKLKSLVIYGSNDEVLNISAMKDNASNLPDGSETVLIDGGNHAQFGNYGPQDGDGEAEITAAQQQEATAKAIVKLAKEL